jgi:hypothetical protein
LPRIRQDRDGLLDSFGVVPIARMDRQKRRRRLGRQIFDLYVNINFPESVPLTFVEGERNDETIAVRGQIGDRRYYPKVRVPFGQVKSA